jgi:hypothetical protein
MNFIDIIDNPEYPLGPGALSKGSPCTILSISSIVKGLERESRFGID